jgi:drug/metabolite transporter superfamily protein YnfA
MFAAGAACAISGCNTLIRHCRAFPSFFLKKCVEKNFGAGANFLTGVLPVWLGSVYADFGGGYVFGARNVYALFKKRNGGHAP